MLSQTHNFFLLRTFILFLGEQITIFKFFATSQTIFFIINLFNR